MWVCILLIALGATSLALFLCEKIRKYSVKETMIKSIASLLFITLAVYGFYHSGHHPFGIFVIVAMIFGLLGDIWLDFKYVFPEQSKSFTYAGFIVFGIGHILYISGMITSFMGENWWWTLLIAIGTGLLGTLGVLLVEKPMKLKYGNYKWICILYSFVLFAMVGTTAVVTISSSFQAVPFNLLFAGGILFAVSDLILSGTYFGEGKERPVDIITNAVTYYAAQYLIAFSLFFL